MDEKTIGNDEVFEKLLNVQHIMEMLRHQRMAERGPAADPTRGRGRIIALLKLKDGVPTREMAEIMGVRVSSLNEVLGKLERDGLVERRQSEADGRVMLVYLTDKGNGEEQAGEHLPDKVFAGFDDEQLSSFGASLDAIVANLEGELGEDAQTLLERGKALREELHADHGHGGKGGHGPGGRGGHGKGGCRGGARGGKGSLVDPLGVFGEVTQHLCDDAPGAGKGARGARGGMMGC